MNKTELAKGVYYVGAVDWNQRDFHGYYTPRGVTYNSYLIVDEKICLIDTVKAPFTNELLERISQIVDPAKIDYVVVNHVEPDHSGALPVIIEHAPNAKVILTANGRAETIKHYHREYDFQVVKEGDVLSLGQNNLHFIPLPMLHWPDSMASYLDGHQILFSNDAFGQHICTSAPCDDQNDIHDILYEAAKYYANILMPYSKLVGRALSKLEATPVKQIAPSHGVVWRSHIDKIIEKYAAWGQGVTCDKVVVIYDALWGSTEQMARRILDGVAAGGVQVKLFKITNTPLSELAVEILEARGLLFGSPTHNNGMMATMGGVMTYLQGLKPTNKIVATFGAYGWSGGAEKAMAEALGKAGIKTEEPGLTLKWVPDEKELEACFAFGLDFAKKVIAAEK